LRQGEILMKKLAPLTGVLFFLLLLASALVDGSTPSASASGAKVLAHYRAHRNATEISGLLIVLAIVVGMFFYGQMRDYLRRHDGVRGFTATAFGGAALFAAAGGMNAGIGWALTDSPSHLSPSAAQTLNLMSMDGTYALESAGIALLFVAFGVAILNSGLLPRWLGWIALPLAVVAVIPPLGFIAFVGVGVWTLIVSISMWRRLASPQSSATPAMAASSPT
jgi:hypothetical protein